MKLGVFGLRADDRGLARQTQGFAKHLHPARVYGFDLTADDLSPYPCHWPDIPNLTVATMSDLDEQDIRKWLHGLDVVIGAETFYDDRFYTWCKEAGVRTILQINPEFAHWFFAGKDAPRPDIFISPTTWRLKYLPGVIHLPFPVDRAEFPFRLRTEANHFVHVAGHLATGDRAGTRILLGALRSLRGIKVTIRSQSKLGFEGPYLRHATVIEENIPSPADLYSDADVIVLPRRYGGQSLVANEALSSGCPVIMLSRDPEKDWPGVVLADSRVRGRMRSVGGAIETYDDRHHGQALASVILALHKSPQMVAFHSKQADRYAESISWDNMLDSYMKLIWGLADQR